MPWRPLGVRGTMTEAMMKNNVMMMSRAGGMTCVWRTTGERRVPLVCVWVMVAGVKVAPADVSLEGDWRWVNVYDEQGGVRLCA